MSRARIRICVVTGSRADYGLLVWPLRELQASGRYDVRVVATGQHLSGVFGDTWMEIEADGFEVAARVESLVPGDTGTSTAKSVGRGVTGFADAFQALEPDLVLVLGDRFEILAAAQASLFMGIPLAHIAGGDVTEGAFDESIRHAITKMAHLHFVTNEEARRRVVQLGEDPLRVHLVGSPGLDAIRLMERFDRRDLERDLDITLGRPNLLVTFHPVTRGRPDSMTQLQELLEALAGLGHGACLIFTMANSDPRGLELTARVEEFCAERSGAHLFQSLGSLRYLSLMALVDCVVGNSSSGLYEAPALATPSVNVGDRQAGRLRAPSVIDADAERSAISKAIDEALALRISTPSSLYGDGDASRRIVAVLDEIGDPRDLLHKRFHDLTPPPSPDPSPHG